MSETLKSKKQDERAELAQAYMKGGLPPYQAARKSGFMRVTIMNEAIQALAKHKASTQEEAAANFAGKPEDDQGELVASEGMGAINISPADPQASRILYTPLTPLWSIEGIGFRASGFAASGGYPAMIRLNTTARSNHYIQFLAEDMPRLLAMLTAADTIRSLAASKSKEAGASTPAPANTR